MALVNDYGSYVMEHLNHYLSNSIGVCEVCSNDGFEEYIATGMFEIQSSEIIGTLWAASLDLIDNGVIGLIDPADVVFWQRDIALHPLSSQEIFDSYLKKLRAEWELQDWGDNWGEDVFADMQTLLTRIQFHPHFASSHQTLTMSAGKIHLGHKRFGFCKGRLEDCPKCLEVLENVETGALLSNCIKCGEVGLAAPNLYGRHCFYHRNQLSCF